MRVVAGLCVGAVERIGDRQARQGAILIPGEVPNYGLPVDAEFVLRHAVRVRVVGERVAVAGTESHLGWLTSGIVCSSIQGIYAWWSGINSAFTIQII